MSQNGKAFAAEFLGLFAFTLVGAGAICTAAAIGAGPAALVSIALAHGLMMAINVASLGHLSGGHFNPAVTVAMLLTGRATWARAFTYVVAQCLGAFAAAKVLAGVFPDFVAAAPYLGATLGSAADLTPGVKMWVEFLLTFLLVSAIFGTAVNPRGPKTLTPFVVGGTIAVDILIGGPLTGASMNPARSFGPMAVCGGAAAADAWLYWVGPLLGGCAAAWLHEYWLIPGGAKK
jgi:MIP family channel proteins